MVNTDFENRTLSAMMLTQNGDLVKKLKGIQQLLALTSSRELARPSVGELPRTIAFYELLKSTEAVDGEWVECGVGLGKSLLLFVAILKYLNRDIKIHAYDSFEGFPEPGSEDKSFRTPKKGEHGSTNEELIWERFRSNGMVNEMVRFVILNKGFFEKTLPQTLPEKISFLHADCDLYQSYHSVLENCYPRCENDSIIIFDEYNIPHWPGAKKAIDEFLSKSNEQIQWFEGIGRYGVRVKNKS